MTVHCKELPDKFAGSELHLSEVFSLANKKLQEQQGLLADIRKGSIDLKLWEPAFSNLVLEL